MRRLFDFIWPRPKNRKWLFLGDSHLETIKWGADNGFLYGESEFCIVPGATAVGMRNPNSITNALAIFREASLPQIQGATPVVHLGEVDCGFVIWWRAKKLGESIDTQLLEAVEAYFEFIDSLIEAGYRTVVVTGATMPTIIDGQDWGDVANKRREVSASLSERIALTKSYNAELRKSAERRKLPFLDISDTITDSSGAVSAEFRNPDPLDHHLNKETAGIVWASRLNRI